MERQAWIAVNSWAGLTVHPVTVLKETPKRYKVRREDTAFRWRKGSVAYLAKANVRFQKPEIPKPRQLFPEPAEGE